MACQPQLAVRRPLRATGDVALLGDEIRALVIALHGYAGGGRDMVDVLRAAAGPGVPALVYAPDGPEKPRLGRVGRGRAWYPVTSQLEAARTRARALAADLIRRIDVLRTVFDVPRSRCCLVGFSQGTTVAGAILEQNPDWGRCVLVSGRVTGPTRAAVGAVPEVLAISGSADRLAPPELIRTDLAASALGRRSRLLELPNLPHEFTPEIAALALSFALAPLQDEPPY